MLNGNVIKLLSKYLCLDTECCSRLHQRGFLCSGPQLMERLTARQRVSDCGVLSLKWDIYINSWPPLHPKECQGCRMGWSALRCCLPVTAALTGSQHLGLCANLHTIRPGNIPAQPGKGLRKLRPPPERLLAMDSCRWGRVTFLLGCGLW